MRKATMDSCPWCGCSIKRGNGPQVKSDWERYRCNGCGTYGYLDNPTVDELGQVYTDAWQVSDTTGSFAAGSTDANIARSLLKAFDLNPQKLKCLDYGGGKGVLAQVLIENGCDDLTVYEPFGKNPGLSSVNWVHDVDRLHQEQFDLIFMVEVIEHLLDPLDELIRIRKHLRPGGKLIITTPNARSWRAVMDGFAWREVQNPTHINLFSARSLKDLLRKAGFTNAKRVLHPVTYKAKGLKAVVLAMTQLVGVDGGLRFLAATSSVD